MKITIQIEEETATLESSSAVTWKEALLLVKAAVLCHYPYLTAEDFANFFQEEETKQ